MSTITFESYIPAKSYTESDPRIKVSDVQMLNSLRKIVAERPDFIYSGPEHQVHYSGARCFYVHTDPGGNPVSPGCVAGCVLADLGVPLDVLAMNEGRGADTVAFTTLNVTGPNASAVTSLLREVQGCQDGRWAEPPMAWGAALEQSERLYGTAQL